MVNMNYRKIDTMNVNFDCLTEIPTEMNACLD